MNDYSKTPLNELLLNMATLEQEINMKMMIYESIRQEVVKRFPPIEKEECFKQKKLVIEGDKNGKRY